MLSKSRQWRKPTEKIDGLETGSGQKRMQNLETRHLYYQFSLLRSRSPSTNTESLCSRAMPFFSSKEILSNGIAVDHGRQSFFDSGVA